MTSWSSKHTLQLTWNTSASNPRRTSMRQQEIGHSIMGNLNKPRYNQWRTNAQLGTGRIRNWESKQFRSLHLWSSSTPAKDGRSSAINTRSKEITLLTSATAR